MEEAVLLLLELTLTLDTDLPSLHTMLQPKLPYLDLQKALSSIMVFHRHCFLGLTLEQMKHGTGPIFMKFISLPMFPHHGKAADLTEWCNGLQKLSNNTS